ncbi:hypothetical protein TNCV_3548341 [Trichonephila clavipes]|nr:hypothetical protein TNCV_3548341 [Trichonephila clavipes]
MPRAHQAGFSRRSLAGVGFFEGVRSHGPDPALLANGDVQHQQHQNTVLDKCAKCQWPFHSHYPLWLVSINDHITCNVNM